MSKRLPQFFMRQTFFKVCKLILSEKTGKSFLPLHTETMFFVLIYIY